ncbi:hypothetical protein D3C78_1468810 [compost metagenome]
MKPNALLGLILVREGILSRAQLDQALAEQGRRREAGAVVPLGVVVMELGVATEGQVKHALRLQKKLSWGPEEAVPLGVRLIENDLVAPSLLVTLMEEQARTGEALEDLLLSRQVVVPAMLDYFKQLS